ncbi:MAG: outer membrane protein [Bosea sp. (in: a-proteobacteria)]
MGSLKSYAIAGAVALGASSSVLAADLPPPPMMEPHAPRASSIGSGWYLRGDVGVGATNYNDIEVLVRGLPPTSPAIGATSFSVEKSKSSVASFVGFGVGYQFNSYFRFDITGEYRGASLEGRDNISFPTVPGSSIRQTNNYRANLASFVTLANAYIDLGTWNCLTPYLGGGIGFASHTINGLTDSGIQDFYTGTVRTGSGTSFAFADSASKTNMAWALMAGVAYDVNPNLKLEVGYRYLNMGDGPNMALRGPSGLLDSSVKFKKLDSHDIKIGMRWTFGDPNCCSTPAAPVAYAPPPAPMPMTRKY